MKEFWGSAVLIATGILLAEVVKFVAQIAIFFLFIKQ